MKKIALTTILVLALSVTARAVQAVPLPSSPEQVHSLSDDQLAAIIDSYLRIQYPVLKAFWQFMGKEYGAGTVAEFRLKFPNTYAYFEDVRRKATASAASGSVIVGQSQGSGPCDENPAYVFVKGGLGFLGQLALSVVYAHHQGLSYDAFEIAETKLRDDFVEQCPDCSSSDIDTMLDLWQEEATDYALLLSESDYFYDPDLAIDVPSLSWGAKADYIDFECLREACERVTGWIIYCKHFPKHPRCKEDKEERSPRCGHFGQGHPPEGGPSDELPFPDPNFRPNGGNSTAGGAGGGAQPRHGAAAPRSAFGNSHGGPELVPPDGFGPGNPDGAGETIDVIDKYPRLPERPLGPGDLVPDDPATHCHGPCCDGKHGGHGDRGECKIDGVQVPCSMLY